MQNVQFFNVEPDGSSRNEQVEKGQESMGVSRK